MDVSQRATSDETLAQAAAQAIDALTFSQTHVLDEDFRAHSKSTLDSVRALKQEQRLRIEQTYGARAPSSAFIAHQLKAIYRGECAAMSIAKALPEKSPSGFAAMTHAQSYAFKREMKHLIHEWERAFREEHGVSVSAQDKVAIRSIYELYKASKYHLTESEQRGEKESAQTSAAAREIAAHSDATAPAKEKAQPPNSFAAPFSAAPAAQPLSSSTTTTTNATTTTTTANATTSGNAQPDAVRIDDTPVMDMSDESLSTEKRYIKRLLHRFEGEFERQHGTPPTREDRKALSREYTRYGELKIEIQRRNGAKTTLNAPDGA